MHRLADQGSVREIHIRAATAEEARVAATLHSADETADPSVLPIVAVLLADRPEIVGTVSLRESEPGVWRVSHLAVATGHRADGRLAVELLRLAVGAARGRGARAVHALVAPEDLAAYRRLPWREDGAPASGRHIRMRACLERYWPVRDLRVGVGLIAPTRSAA